MFAPDERERVRTRLIERARADDRIVAAAAVGSSASGGDRWSDLDLTFAVADRASLPAVLADWTAMMVAEHQATELFDLPVESTIYRVFLLPEMLQVDLSFAPAAEFGARSPRFSLLFGEAVTLPTPPPPSWQSLFGWGVHHLLRGHINIERGRTWEAEYWISAARDHALTLACLRLGLPASYARGFDSLPGAVRDALTGSIVRVLSAAELRRALRVAADGLLAEARDQPALQREVRAKLSDIWRTCNG